MRIKLILLICFFTISVRAQVDSAKKVTTTAALLYNSDISYFGQATTTSYPYVLANVTLRLPFGLYFAGGGYQLLNDSTGISEADLGIGYDYQFNDTWSTSIAYTRSFFPATSPLLAASNENNINISTTYEGQLFKSALAIDYAFGKQQDIFITLTNSKSIDLGSFFTEKNQLSIEPTFEVFAGTRHFYQTYITIQQQHNNGKGKGNGMQSNQILTTEIPKNSFNLFSYNFKLPITLSRANYLIEASYQLGIMGKKAEESLKSHFSIYGIAFYYQF